MRFTTHHLSASNPANKARFLFAHVTIRLVCDLPWARVFQRRPTAVEVRGRAAMGWGVVNNVLVPFHPFKNILPEMRQGYPLNLSILISGGKETNKDSPSNGE